MVELYYLFMQQPSPRKIYLETGSDVFYVSSDSKNDLFAISQEAKWLITLRINSQQ